MTDSRITPSPRELATVLVAGAVILLVVHALGRFIYTPLLPYLVGDGLLTPSEGASVATWNYLGYLIGALLAIRWYRPDHIRKALPIAMLVHVVITLLQTQVEAVAGLSALRLVNGIANGVVFVQAPALILEWLVRRNRASSSGLVYVGVGVGLLLSSFLVTGTADLLSGPARWWPAALLSIPLAWWATRRLLILDVPARIQREDGSFAEKGPLLDRASIPLFLSYAGAGMGYILPMTFLPLLTKTQLPEGHWLVDGSWLFVALVTIPTPILWSYLGSRMGDLRALRLNYLIQFLGALSVVIWPGPTGIILCALLVGSTFVGTVLLTQRIGRALHPHQGPRLSAAMVALYSVTQMAGPWLTRQWLEAGGTLIGAFSLGAVALGLGLFFALFVPHPEDWHGR
ncbi:Predicted arabinose efflux permease, MFS family [Marinobacter daqiaonensis]|uniref:Predicted arabinose efflux permease, MFS family n=1 Tax=Marinobacter daqiaonensis TaxID=650891 RepID=A0A1I6IGM0_9GAMM|nr:YbfB/YjiJ family MFS transporter [Marinobacter daqiaonensis]SFR65892.1 Predicted arabinose efflux permease, MFS family [Marinobacter daqiaonensis]